MITKCTSWFWWKVLVDLVAYLDSLMSLIIISFLYLLHMVMSSERAWMERLKFLNNKKCYSKKTNGTLFGWKSTDLKWKFGPLLNCSQVKNNTISKIWEKLPFIVKIMISRVEIWDSLLTIWISSPLTRFNISHWNVPIHMKSLEKSKKMFPMYLDLNVVDTLKKVTDPLQKDGKS